MLMHATVAAKANAYLMHAANMNACSKYDATVAAKANAAMNVKAKVNETVKVKEKDVYWRRFQEWKKTNAGRLPEYRESEEDYDECGDSAEERKAYNTAAAMMKLYNTAEDKEASEDEEEDSEVWDSAGVSSREPEYMAMVASRLAALGGAVPSLICFICQEPKNMAEQKVLPCGHEYHCSCIANWQSDVSLRGHNQCPECCHMCVC